MFKDAVIRFLAFPEFRGRRFFSSGLKYDVLCVNGLEFSIVYFSNINNQTFKRNKLTSSRVVHSCKPPNGIPLSL